MSNLNKNFQRKDKEELMAYKIEQGIATWTPAENPKATTDPYKTLFIGRIVCVKAIVNK